ncbi:guanylate kinase [Rhodothalassium salexigens DSM 2132]|uniref:Guanylate kinase n=2 Tax=Rhodothalassium salexigens TaxID=1086 RepID=A0A4R2PRD8_RHOSA|nr:guanylate kinase [Rhodothalassium salexigens DSM 2132]TCP38433.1 guanylate kinase [Rhodothalassium salexigens DSM 2132]
MAATTRRGLMLVMSSPSGAGKSTLSRKLLAADDGISLSVSATTRPARPGEVDGRDYFFVSADEFARMVEAGEFLEHATVFGNRYGTPRGPVEAALQAGRDVLFDIDWQGTQQIAETMADDLVRVFILPPRIDELERRLRERAQDSAEVVARRMDGAMEEISHWAEYDYVLVNDALEACYDRLCQVLNAERWRRRRQPWLSAFVTKLREEGAARAQSS